MNTVINKDIRIKSTEIRGELQGQGVEKSQTLWESVVWPDETKMELFGNKSHGLCVHGAKN